MRSTRLFTLFATTTLMLGLAGSALAQAVAPFAAPQTYPSSGNPDGPSTYWSATGDFNGDGYIDMAAPDIRSLNNILGFSVTFGRAGGGFDAPVTRVVGTFIRQLRAGDFNHDGRADLIIVTMGGAAVMPGNADGTFGPLSLIPAGLVPNDAILGDFNGDGNIDVVLPGDLGYAVALGTGAGTFTRGPLMREAAATSWAIVGDFNNDGAQDFTGAGGIFGHTYFGNGDGTFQAPIDAGFSATADTVSGDFNGDGNIDIAVISATPRQDGSNYGFKIAVGFGNGTFNPYLGWVLSQQQIGNLVTADFNGDGLTDLATSVAGNVRVFAGDRLRFLGAELLPNAYAAPGMLYAGDLDANGSPDLVISNTQNFTVFRNTRGNPPLLAALTLSPSFVIGGTGTSALVQLGDAAPAGGAVVNLSSSDPALASVPATVTIPEGASSATFAVSTSDVISAASVTVSAEWNGLSQTTQLSLVPAYTLTGISINPASQYGIFNVTGTLTLSNPADTAAVVQLSSANPAVASVPASVTVPAGATTVDFTIALKAVTADTPVAITATRGDASFSATVTVLKAADSVSVSKAIDTQKTGELRIEASSTSATTTLTVYNAATGALLGTLDNAGGGKYKGSVFLFVPANAAAPKIVLKSALGGTTTATVQVK